MSNKKIIKKNVGLQVIKKLESMNTLFDEIPTKREIIRWSAVDKKNALVWLELLEKFIATSFQEPEELPEPPDSGLLIWTNYTASAVVEGITGALKLIDLQPPNAEAVAFWPPYKRALAVLWFAAFSALVGRADDNLKSTVTPEKWIPKYIRQELPGAIFQESSQ